MSRRRPFAFDALPVDTMSIPVAGVGASPYVDLGAPARCFGYGGYGGLPATAYATTAAKAALHDKNSAALSSPEAQLAASVFEGAMSGKAGAAEAAISQAGATLAAAGAAAACAATGAGAAVAPLCAMAGSLIFAKVSGFFGGGGAKSCLKAQEEGAQAQMAAYLSAGPSNEKLFCAGDSTCRNAIERAAYDYMDRLNWWCSMFYNWPLTEAIRAEGKKLGLPPWPVPAFTTAGALDPQGNREAIRKAEDDRRRYTYNFHDPRWAAYAKEKYLGEVTKAIADRKVKTWAKAAADAKKTADAEYDTLVRSCPKAPPQISLNPFSKPLTGCQRKAADAASIIAARAYMYAVIDGAPAVQATETQGLRSQFAAEIAQDAVVAGLVKARADELAEDEKEEREKRSKAIRAALMSKEQRPKIVMGFALATALVAGGIYLHRRRALSRLLLLLRRLSPDSPTPPPDTSQDPPMSNYTHIGFAGFGIDEFKESKAQIAANAAAVAAARKRAGVISISGSPVKAPIRVPVQAPVGTKLTGQMPSTVAPPQQIVPGPQLTVDVANAGDPTAPPTPGNNDPVPVMVFEEMPASTDWVPLAVGAGVLVAAGVAIFFATRKGK